MLSPVIAEQLRLHGYDVEAIAGDPAREGPPDRDVMELTRSEHRAVVTNNVDDFRPLHNEAVVSGGAGPSAWSSCPATTAGPRLTRGAS